MIKLNEQQTNAQQVIDSIKTGVKYMSASRTGAIVDTQAGDLVSISYVPNRRFEDLTETQEQREIAKLLQRKAKEAIDRAEEKADRAIYENKKIRSKLWENCRNEIEEFESAIASLNLFLEELDRNESKEQEEIEIMI